MRWIVFTLLLVAACAQPPEDIVVVNASNETFDLAGIEDAVGYASVREIDVGLSTFLVEGYLLGIAQTARFEQLIGKMEFDSRGMLVGVSAMINAKSLVTDLRVIDDEIKKDVLLAEEFGTISFRSTSIKRGVMRGVLGFRGLEREVEIPIESSQGRMKGEFLLDLSEFGVDKNGLDDEVLVRLDIVHKNR